MVQRDRLQIGITLLGLAAVAVVAAALSAHIPLAAGAEHLALEDDMDIPCTECHSDLIEGEVVHPPAADGDCETCHEFSPAEEEWTVALSAPEEEICLMCHENPAEVEAADSIHMPAAEAMCVICHNPHSSSRKGLFREEGNSICFECHGDQQEELARPHLHGVIADLGCPSCHNPHASVNSRLLRAAGNGLCMECHLNSARGHTVDDSGEVVLFGNRKVGKDYYDRMPKLNLVPERLSGHPTSKHPLEADTDPRRPELPFGCASCHEPHGSENPKLLIGGQGFGLCRQCHKK